MATRTFTYKLNMDLAGIKAGSKTMQVTLASMQGDAAKSEASMKKLADTMAKRYGVEVKVAKDETKSFQNAIRQAAREANKAEKNYEQVTKEFKHLEATIGMTTDQLQVFNAQQRLGANASEQQKKQVADLVMGYQRMRNETNKTQGSMRGLRGQAQNVGWQLQDVAVQAQMGTNALTILGQQGSQFASGFGPMGALIGAGIAVVAASIGVLAPSLMKATENAKNLNEELIRTSKLKGLTDQGSTVLIAEQEKAIDGYRKEFLEIDKKVKINDKLYGSYDEYTKRQLELSKSYDAITGRIKVSVLTEKEWTKANEKSQLAQATRIASMQNLNEKTIAARKEIKRIKDALNGGTDEQEKNRKSNQELVKSLNDQVAVYGLSEVQLLRREKALKLLELNTTNATVAQKESVSSNYDTLISLQELSDETEQYELFLKSLASQQAKDDASNKARDSLLKSQSKANKNIVDSLRQQADTLGYTAEQNLNYQRGLKLLQLATTNATDAQIDATNAYYDQLVAAEQLTAAEAELTKTVNARAKRSDSGKLAQLEMEQAAELKAVGNHQESITEINSYYAKERLKITGTELQKYALKMQETMQDTDQIMVASLDRLVSGFGNAMSEMVMGSKSPADALKDMFKGAIGSMVQFFAEWAAQKLILWALDKTLSATTQGGEATAMALNTGAKVAEAGLNAYASTAAIPIAGPALAPTAAGIAISAASSMASTATTLSSAAVGVYDKGGLIPAGGAGIVSEIGDELVGGTMIYNGSQNSLGVTGREATARMGGNSGPVNISVNSSGNASPEAISRALVRALKRKSKGLDTGLYDAMNRGRTNRGKRFNA